MESFSPVELKLLNLTVNQYYVLQYLKATTKIRKDELEPIIDINKTEYYQLYKKGYLTQDPNNKDEWKPSDFAETLLFQREAGNFNNLYNMYPKSKISEYGNTVYLRGSKLEAQRLYNQLVQGNVENHKLLLSALKEYLNEQSSTNLKYIKPFYQWLKTICMPDLKEIEDEKKKIAKESTEVVL